MKNAEIWQQIAEILEKYEHEVRIKEEHPYKGWMLRELEHGKA